MTNTAGAERQPVRCFIDLTTSFRTETQAPLSVLRAEQEIGRRLVADPRLKAIPIVFHAGKMFALESDQLLSAFDNSSLGEIRDEKIVKSMSAPALDKKITYAARRRGVLGYVKAFARAIGRMLIRLAPLESRYDVRLALIHSRAAIRNFFGNSQTQQNLEKSSGSEEDTAATLTMVVHPRAGDVLWTCGEYNCVPLRLIGEEKRISHFRVAAIGYDTISTKYPDWSAANASEDPSTATIDLFDAADLIYCLSQKTRDDLVGLSAAVYRPNAQFDLLLPIGASSAAAEAASPDNRDAAPLQMTDSRSSISDPKDWDAIADSICRGLLRLARADCTH